MLKGAAVARLAVEVRMVFGHELDAIQDLDERAYSDPDSDESNSDDVWNYLNWEQVWQRPGWVVLVAVHDHVIRGFLVYSWNSKASQLLRVAVHPDFRRRKVGQQLLASWRERIRHKGGPRRHMSVVVPEEKLKACAFFKACGLQPGEADDGHITFEDGTPAAQPTKRKKGEVPLSIQKRMGWSS